ncbi:hypothetical protein LTR37_001434 [Vermiconidia calcicola]|uniref:Uncharacterized protein n=1 Tax=Vermiconidia calcicola TaxID=1690605 RepID=A0ACC3NYF0_9PEZI|nr:hypothetical protein LTR37_001434 [Vermiconidia calcicola]
MPHSKAAAEVQKFCRDHPIDIADITYTVTLGTRLGSLPFINASALVTPLIEQLNTLPYNLTPKTNVGLKPSKIIPPPPSPTHLDPVITLGLKSSIPPPAPVSFPPPTDSSFEFIPPKYNMPKPKHAANVDDSDLESTISDGHFNFNEPDGNVIFTVRDVMNQT